MRPMMREEGVTSVMRAGGRGYIGGVGLKEPLQDDRGKGSHLCHVCNDGVGR